jgi:exonuclease SbcD
MRILHSADWHLGRIFHNVHLTDDQAYVLDQFVALAKDAKPDVIVIAGDVYDRAVPPPEAVSLLDEVLSRLALDCKVPVVVIAGNHDSPERLAFGERVLARQKLHVAGQAAGDMAPVAVHDAHGPVYFCPIPYAEPAVVRERLAVEAAGHEAALAALVARAVANVPAGARKVAVAHAFVAGGAASESERPLAVGTVPTVDAAVFAAFDYTALGHLHQAQNIGGGRVRYAGSPLKYSFAEAGHRKSVTLVELDGAGRATAEEIALRPRRDVRCVDGYLADILAAGERDEHAGDYIAVTLKDSGAILDPMGKLRRVYPNVLHRIFAATAAATATGPRVDHRRQSEAELFAAFYAQATGQALNEAETAAAARLLAAFGRREREAGA